MEGGDLSEPYAELVRPTVLYDPECATKQFNRAEGEESTMKHAKKIN